MLLGRLNGGFPIHFHGHPCLSRTYGIILAKFNAILKQGVHVSLGNGRLHRRVRDSADMKYT